MKKVFSVCLSVLLMILLLCTGVIGCNRPQTNATPSASINANETAGTASSVQPTILPTVEKPVIGKIYCIDDDDHCTMLLAEEY